MYPFRLTNRRGLLLLLLLLELLLFLVLFGLMIAKYTARTGIELVGDFGGVEGY